MSPLSYLPFSSFLFFSPALMGWAPLSCIWVHWFFLLLHLVCYWTPALYFSGQLLNSLSLWLLVGTFLYFLSPCWNFHFILLLFFLAKCISFGPLFWTLYQVNHLSPFQKVFLWGFNLLYCLEYISLFLHLTCLSVWFYAWNKVSPFPSLEEVTSYSKHNCSTLP